MALFTPAWKMEAYKLSRNPEKLKKAIDFINKLEDQDKLRTIADEALHHKVIIAALNRIDDPQFLMKFALGRRGNETSLAAVSRIHDDRMLREIALHGHNDRARGAAAAAIQNQKMLLEIAETSWDYHAAPAAASGITDPDLVMKLAMSKKAGCAFYALRRISDSGFLKKIAFEAPSDGSRAAAVEKIDDPDTIISVMEKEESRDVIVTAWNTIGKIFEKGGPGLPTEEQFSRLVAVMQDKPDVRESMKNMASYDSGFRWKKGFEKIWLEATKEDRRAADVLSSVQSAENSRLPDIWREANVMYGKARGEYKRTWGEVRKAVEKRLEKSRDPDLLMTVIRDPEFGADNACNCLSTLFKGNMDDTADIAALQEQAALAYIRNIPSYSAKDGVCFVRIAKLLPDDLREKLGITITESEVEDEDQFGRYTYTRACVTYHGKSYYA